MGVMMGPPVTGGLEVLAVTSDGRASSSGAPLEARVCMRKRLDADAPCSHHIGSECSPDPSPRFPRPDARWCHEGDGDSDTCASSAPFLLQVSVIPERGSGGRVQTAVPR